MVDGTSARLNPSPFTPTICQQHMSTQIRLNDVDRGQIGNRNARALPPAEQDRTRRCFGRGGSD